MHQSLGGRSLRDGEYIVRDVMGQGGMAHVYRAYSKSLETDLALKVLAPHLAADADLRDRFHEEARLLSRLFHPNLLTVHYFGEEGDTVYIAMRLVTGGTLRDRMRAMGGRLDLVSAARLIRGVADALQAAHDANIVHLDVKPSNVLLGRADWPLLADTGIAEVMQTATVAPGGRRIAGTPAYMSPEQCRGDAVDGSSDQYSLAATAFELLTGKVPFDAPTTQDLLQRQINDPPPRVRELNPGLPSPVEDILLRGLAKQPADRFPSVGEFGRALADAAERTRGVSLETKTSLADAAPNILATLALLALGPLLLGLLPADAMLAGLLPLGWPFQLALALCVSTLVLGIRWHLVGLVARAGGRLVDAIERTRPESGNWRVRLAGIRRAVIASAEGVVNVGYLLGLYHLLGTPIVGLLGALLDAGVARLLELGLLATVTLAVLGIVVSIARSGGLGAAALVLGAAWAMAAAPSSSELGLANSTSLVSVVRLLVGAGLLAVLVARRRQTAELLGGAAIAGLGRLVVESRPDASPEVLLANRTALATVTAAVLDVVYLLLGYALLRAPLIEELQVAVGPLVAAVIVTAAAGLIWAVLVVRLQALAGAVGLLLGMLLGAPLLLSLPILDQRVVNAAWPATTVAWVVGVGLLLLLLGLRSRVHAFARPSLGARLDRGMLGMYAAADEVVNQQRQGAFGRIASALIDVAFLVLGYWVLGAPIAASLVRSTGHEWIGTAGLAILLAAVVGVLGLAVLGTWRTLAETGGPAWRARAGALAVLTLLFLPLLVVGAAAAPAALAMPAATGGLELQPIRVPLLIADWDFWLPFQPRQDQATYQLGLSCTDGRKVGQFRETYQPPAGAPVPAGQVGALGRTNVACDNWPVEYAARRAAAGLGTDPSLSWDTLDVRATVNLDDSVDVVETHHVVFTSGRHDHLAVKAGAPAADLDRLGVAEGELVYAIEPPVDRPAPQRYARSWEIGDQYWVGWWFPELTSPAERTYSVSYRLNSAVHATPDARRALLWRVVPPDSLEPIWLATVQVRLPSSVDPATVRLAVGGVAGQSGLLEGRTAWFAASSAIGDTGFDASVDFPSTAPPPPTPTQTPSPTPISTTTPSPTATQPPTPSPSPTLLICRPGTQPAVQTDGSTVCVEVAVTSTPTEVPAAANAPTATASPTSPSLPPTGTPTPTDTPLPATPTDTPVPTTPTDTPLPTPTATITPAPPTPTPTRTTTPTATATPDCPTFASSVAATPTTSGTVNLAWTSSGGCSPYSGTISATRSDQSVPYASYPVSGASGTQADTPSAQPACAAVVVDYTLQLSDARSHTTSASARVPFTPPTPPFGSPKFTATPNGDGTVGVTWSSTGGCGPYVGTISAQILDSSSPYRTISVQAASGSVSDTPPQPASCGTTVRVVYTLNLSDHLQQAVTATANASFTPTVAALTAALQVQPNPDGTLQVTWTSTGGCPAYNGTLTIKYPTDSRQVTVSGASGAFTDQPPQFDCSTGVTYTLALNDGSGQKASASKSAAIPVRQPLGSPKLDAFRNRDGSATLTWSAQGGCGPYTGTITAAYDWPPGSARFPINASSGSMVDANAARCTNGSLSYTLNLSDSTKATVNFSTGRVVWCLG